MSEGSPKGLAIVREHPAAAPYLGRHEDAAHATLKPIPDGPAAKAYVPRAAIS